MDIKATENGAGEEAEMKRAVLNLHTVLMSILIAIALTTLILLAMGIRPRILVTSSMEPENRKNSLVLLDTSADWDELDEGNVIAFRANSTGVLHRITEKTENGSLIVIPDKGTGGAVVDKSMYAGKEIVAFPVIGGWIRGILEHGVFVVWILTGVRIVIGCVPWKKRVENAWFPIMDSGEHRVDL